MSHDAHAEHGHDAADDAHHDAHHDEPPPPPEPETPLWFTLVGAVLFVVLGVAFLTMTSDDAPPKPAPAAKRAQAAAAAAPPPASGPVPPPRRQPPRPTAVELRRRSPGPAPPGLAGRRLGSFRAGLGDKNGIDPERHVLGRRLRQGRARAWRV